MGQVIKNIIALLITVLLVFLAYLIFIEKRSLDSLFKAGKEKVGEKALELKVKSQIHFNKNFKDCDITVTAEEGVVTITGTVNSPRKAVLAAQIADSVEGVERVINKIKVSSTLEDISEDGRSEREKLLDKELQEKAQAVIDTSAELKGAEIKVIVFKRVVFLSGTTITERQKDFAVRIVRRLDGIRDVKDEMRLKYN